LLDAEPTFEPRKVCDDASAEPDQEAGKHERNHPHEQAEQAFRHAQALKHL
jgi:hypothetical protein